MSNARRERLIRIGSWLVIVFALLPAITYMGHWPVVSEHVHADEESSLEEHEAHCHVGVSHCAGGEAMVGSTWVGEAPSVLDLTSPDQKVEISREIAPIEGVSLRLLQPPRTV